jgi:hypothetical protein
MATSFARYIGHQKRLDLRDRLDVGSLLTLRAVDNFKRNALTCFQGFKPWDIDSGEVREDSFATFIRGDKSKTLGVVKRLDCA